MKKRDKKRVRELHQENIQKKEKNSEEIRSNTERELRKRKKRVKQAAEKRRARQSETKELPSGSSKQKCREEIHSRWDCNC